MAELNMTNVVSRLKEIGIESDLIDFESYPGDIPLKEWLLNEYGISLTNVREQADYWKAQQEKQNKEEKEKNKEEERKLLESIKAEKFRETVNINAFQIWQSYIKTVNLSDEIHFLIGLGEGGLGKSFSTVSCLKQLDVDYAYLNSKTTPLALYEFLYKNKDKLILFDDVIGLLDSEISVSILLSALWSATSQRIIQYNTTAKVFEEKGLPAAFEFTGKIILLTNHMNFKNKFLRALQDRGYFFEFNFSYDEKIAIMREIIQVDHKLESIKREEVLEFMISNSCPATKNFSFRTLLKAFNLRLYNENWQELVKSILVEDERILFVWKSMGIKGAWKAFMEEGYGSRATYFNIKKSLKV